MKSAPSFGWPRSMLGKPGRELPNLGLPLFAIVLALLPIGGKARAGDSGAATLAARETFSVRINGVYRDIRVCNDRGSAGEIVAVISQHEPVRLAPGDCRFGQGDRIHLENISPGTVRVIYLVVGVHQS